MLWFRMMPIVWTRLQEEGCSIQEIEVSNRSLLTYFWKYKGSRWRWNAWKLGVASGIWPVAAIYYFVINWDAHGFYLFFFFRDVPGHALAPAWRYEGLSPLHDGFSMMFMAFYFSFQRFLKPIDSIIGKVCAIPPASVEYSIKVVGLWFSPHRLESSLLWAMWCGMWICPLRNKWSLSLFSS